MKLFPRKLLDLIYPPSCHFCSQALGHGRYLCTDCINSCRRIEAPFCQQCGETYSGEIATNFCCPNCSKVKFDFLYARAALLNTAKNHQLIHDLKYLKHLHLAPELARLCSEVLNQDPRFANLPSPALVPIPLHWRRSLQRGFNQAGEIAESLAHITQTPIVHALKRTRHTPSQTRLNRQQRLKNLTHAFGYRRPLSPEIRSVILIDDVFTTGATAQACASSLKKHTPQLENIVVLTAMRG